MAKRKTSRAARGRLKRNAPLLLADVRSMLNTARSQIQHAQASVNEGSIALRMLGTGPEGVASAMDNILAKLIVSGRELDSAASIVWTIRNLAVEQTVQAELIRDELTELHEECRHARDNRWADFYEDFRRELQRRVG